MVILTHTADSIHQSVADGFLEDIYAEASHGGAILWRRAEGDEEHLHKAILSVSASL